MRHPSPTHGAGPRFPPRVASLRVLALLFLGLLSLAGCSGTATAVAPARGEVSRSGPGGITCHAGTYVCQLPAYGPIDAPCSCPGLGAPSYGTIR
jgi:hypothetical protein